MGAGQCERGKGQNIRDKIKRENWGGIRNKEKE